MYGFSVWLALVRAAVLLDHGGPDQLVVRDDVDVPVPAEDEVLIAVAACGMNNTDINTRTGWYSKSVTSETGGDATESHVDGSWGGGLTFPRIQGADPAGRIVAVGASVEESRIGQRVVVDAWHRSPDGDLDKARYLGSELDGGFAEYVAVRDANAHFIETNLSDIELASFPCSYATAEHMLHRAEVGADQWVLVSGASGGVGGALIQLAKRRGARVIAIAGAAKLDQVKEVGADVVIARETDDIASAVVDAVGRVDVFADVVAGIQFAPLLEIIKRGGHYTTAGAIGGPIVELDVRTLYLNDLTMHGATVLPSIVFRNLVNYIEREEIKPVVAAVYPLEEIHAAQAAFLRKEHVGSFVIEIAG